MKSFQFPILWGTAFTLMITGSVAHASCFCAIRGLNSETVSLLHTAAPNGLAQLRQWQITQFAYGDPQRRERETAVAMAACHDLLRRLHELDVCVAYQPVASDLF